MKTVTKLLKLFILSATGILCGCSDDDKKYIEEIIDNTTDIAVTGDVDSYGVTYAYLRGLANLSLMPTGSGEIGMEISVSDDDSSIHQQTSSSLSGNTFVVEFCNLSPNTEYNYRSFVRYNENTHYGEYRKFTTKKLSDVTITGEAIDVTHSSATITSTVNPMSAYSKEVITVGVAYSTSLDSFNSYSIDVKPSFYTWGERSIEELLNGTYTVTLGFLSEDTTYYYAAFAEVDGRYGFGEVKSFTTEEDGFVPSGAVDLGLSVMWATCNLGANSPEEYGGYYAWGETEEKGIYNWETYKWCEGAIKTLTKYCTDISYGTIDGKTELDIEDDAAHMKLDGSWRMPTIGEIEELKNECTWEWTECNGVDGQLVTGPNGNSVFLPAAGYRSYSSLISEEDGGYYLSTKLYEGYSSYWNNHCCVLEFDDDDVYTDESYRHYGLSVRPVIE